VEAKWAIVRDFQIGDAFEMDGKHVIDRTRGRNFQRPDTMLFDVHDRSFARRRVKFWSLRNGRAPLP